MGRKASLTPQGNNNMNFWLARDHVVLLETAANLCASRRQPNDFFSHFSIFELGGISKYLTTGPAGNSEFCFPSISMVEGLGETKLTVSPGASH